MEYQPNLCPVCIEPINANSIRTPCCGQFYCNEDYSHLITTTKSCPTCRSTLPSSLEEHKEILISSLEKKPKSWMYTDLGNHFYKENRLEYFLKALEFPDVDPKVYYCLGNFYETDSNVAESYYLKCGKDFPSAFIKLAIIHYNDIHYNDLEKRNYYLQLGVFYKDTMAMYILGRNYYAENSPECYKYLTECALLSKKYANDTILKQILSQKC